ncbi:MAG: hypothetical protein F4Z72_04300 [Gemmatimonadales bacterium]|nr:hypothetical protein [Candidatus Palauibacter irciniicola]MYC17821.1 hypothetical protein [Gemmatimonadales bacterium]
MRRPLALLIVLAACAAPPQLHDFDNSFTVQAPLDDAWEAVIDAFGESLWPIEEMERASGFISTDWVRITTAQLVAGMDCGRAQGLGSTEGHMARFNVVVREQAVGETEITVNTSLRANRVALSGGITDVVTCTSRGTIEAFVADEVFRQLDAP